MPIMQASSPPSPLLSPFPLSSPSYWCIFLSPQERHLQDVIHAQQSNRNTKHVVIPTPENAIHVPEYDSITNSIDGAPPQYIRLPGTLSMPSAAGITARLLGTIT